MTRNVGTLDRVVRLGGAVALVGVAVATGAWPVVGLAGLVIVSALVGYSPLYGLYRLSTIGGIHRACGDDCDLPVK